MSKEFTIINEEREFAFAELFFSTTDKSGKITSWNEVFRRISGYEEKELKGKPHSLVRHPDMPRGVFQLLWDTILDNKIVGAYVKNRANDGRYYWVYALVLPFESGFLSIRLKPSSEIFSIVKSQYAALITFENELLNSGAKKSDVAAQSKLKLLENLRSLGFESYFDFMKASLPAEILARDAKMREGQKGKTDILNLLTSSNRSHRAFEITNQVAKFSRNLSELFADLSRSIDISQQVNTSFKETDTLAHEIKRGALNATIEATRLGSHGEALFVLADHLGLNGRKTIDELRTAESICRSSLESVSSILFIASVAKLQTEALSSFLLEVISNSAEGGEEMDVDRVALLLKTFNESVKDMVHQYDSLGTAFGTMLASLEELRMLFISLKVAHVSARTEASRIEAASRFSQVFDEVCAVVDRGRSSLDNLTLKLENFIYTLRNRSGECTSLGRNAIEIAGLPY